MGPCGWGVRGSPHGHPFSGRRLSVCPLSGGWHGPRASPGWEQGRQKGGSWSAPEWERPFTRQSGQGRRGGCWGASASKEDSVEDATPADGPTGTKGPGVPPCTRGRVRGRPSATPTSASHGQPRPGHPRGWRYVRRHLSTHTLTRDPTALPTSPQATLAGLVSEPSAPGSDPRPPPHRRPCRVGSAFSADTMCCVHYWTLGIMYSGKFRSYSLVVFLPASSP